MVNPAEMNISLNELNHHGILGMKWGIRRFQKYPAGYNGDGKYVGPDGQPRQPTRKEARRDRKYNELKAKIDKWLVDSVETGDKKTLKRLKKTMTPQQYQSAYDALVKKGISDAVKSGDKAQLKKYKDDVSKNEYRDAKTLADFNDAVNKLDTERMNRLVGKIKNEDIKESAQRIAAMTEFQNKKVGALKVESEAAAKLSKVANTAATVAKLATSAKTVYDAVSGAKKNYEDRQYELQKRAEEIQEKNKKKQIERIINRQDEGAFKKMESEMTNEQIEAYKKRKFLNNEKEINKAILTGDAKTKEKWADLIGRANVETLNKATTKDKHNNEGGAKGIKGETIGKTEKNQNDQKFSSMGNTSYDKAWEKVMNAGKGKFLNSELRSKAQTLNDNLEKLMSQKDYSSDEVAKAKKYVDENYTNILNKINQAETVKVTTKSSASDIKNILDARVEAIFSNDSSVPSVGNKYWMSYPLENIKKLGK